MSRLAVVIPTLGRDTVVRTVETLLAARGGAEAEIAVAGKIADPAVLGRLREIMARHGNVRHLEIQFEKGDSSRKKNEGAAATSGDIVAFLDDDVEVAEDWPEKMLAVFADEKVGLASGPGLVPEGLNEIGRQAGLALSSGAAGYVAGRYVAGGEDARAAGWDEIIGCNAAYRRRAFEEIGGFPEEFYPGEEMLAAFRTERAGWGLRFVPGARVWHWPRQGLRRFWRQIWSYGATRIRLMRAGVTWNWKPLVPGAWVAVTVGLAVAAIWWPPARWLLALDLVSYGLVTWIMTLATMRRTRRWKDWHLWPMIWVMHTAYGVGEWAEVFCPKRDLSDKPVGG